MFAEKNNRKIVYVTDEKTRKIEFEKIYFWQYTHKNVIICLYNKMWG
jgi:hypothetical protein